MAHADSLRQIRQDPRPAYFVRDDTLLATSKLLVFSLEDDRRTREVFQHELTHRFMAHYFPAAPRWLNEGMATFLEATELDGDEVVVGAAPFPYEFDGFQWKSFKSPFADIVPSITELRATRGQLQSREYAGSWALVHLLMLGRPEHRAAFARYLDALRTAEVSEEEAFNASFDAPLRAELDGAYHAFPTLRTALPTQSVRLTKRTDDDFAARPLTLAERYALWGGLRSTNSLQAPLALGDAESAIRADPTAPHGYALRGRLRLAANDLPGAIADYRAASARERQDHEHLRALAFLQLKQDGASEEVGALVARLEPLADVALDFELLALYQRKKRAPERALSLAIRATRADPGCFQCYQTASLLAAELGDQRRALSLQRIAVNVAAEAVSEPMPGRLARLEKAALTRISR